MSASHVHTPSEIHLSHATWRQGSRYGMWKGAAVVDGTLVAESTEGPVQGEPVQLRLTLEDRRSVSLLAHHVHCLREPGQPDLMMVLLELEPEMLAEMASPMASEPPAPDAVAEPVAKAPLPRVVRLSLILSMAALLGAVVLTFSV
ncbi:MAG: hypothetical protein ACI9VR_002626 [Cognaticolwellia sp.]|jgi:hypothetical protein